MAANPLNGLSTGNLLFKKQRIVTIVTEHCLEVEEDGVNKEQDLIETTLKRKEKYKSLTLGLPNKVIEDILAATSNDVINYLAIKAVNTNHSILGISKDSSALSEIIVT